MCNANRHPQPCGCGFGPLHGNPGDPIPRAPQGGGFQGRVHRGPRTSWWDQAIKDIGILKKGLREVGVDKQTTDRAILAYRKARLRGGGGKDDIQEENRTRLTDILKQIVGLRKYKIEKRKTKTIKVPLFTFGAPSVNNSRVIYEETTDFSEEKGWVVSLIVPGIGMGSSQEFRTQFSCQFSCEPGQFKTIFVPVRIRVSKLGIYEKGKRIKDGGLRITAEGGKAARNYRRGIETCDQKDCQGFSEKEMDEFLLSGNAKKSISKYTEQLSQKAPIDINLGLDILGMKTALKARVSLEKKIRLEYDLPGGYDYHLYGLIKQLGIGWKVSRPRKRKLSARTRKGKQHGHPARQNRKARTGQLHSRAVTFH
jgi:hypothetical protein